MKNQTRLRSAFQLWNPFCSANKEDSAPPVQARKAEQNLYTKQEKSLRKCWLVYADSPVKVLPKLLLWELLWTLPAPPGSYQRSHVFLLQSPSAVRSARRAGGVFSPTTAVTHIVILKKKTVHCCNGTTTFTSFFPTPTLRRGDN